MNEKERRLADFCRTNGFDGALLRRRSNIAWITDGADVHVDTANPLGIAALLWTPGRKMVFTDNIEGARLRAEEPLGGWEIVEAAWWDAGADALGEAIERSRYATDWPDDSIAELRYSLTAAEIECVRGLGRDTAEVVEWVMMHGVRTGMTEWMLGGAVAGSLRERGIFTHVLLVAADERIANFRHPIPTAKKIERVAMVAVCAQRSGLIVSATRLVHFGPLGDDLRRRHEAVCAVDAALHSATRPGVRWCDALAAGVRVYEQTGFGDEWKLHHQGGPMGYECRDFKATPTQMRTVQVNQLVGWNPSITGTKSEDTIIAGANGFEVVTSTGRWPIGSHGRPDILVR